MLILYQMSLSRGGSRAAATSKMEHFVTIVDGFQPLAIITKRSTLDVAAALDPPLLSPSPLEEERISVLLSGRKLLNDLKFLFEIWTLLIKPSQNFLKYPSLKLEVAVVWTIFLFLNGALWWPMRAKSCLIFLTFLLLFVYLIFCSFQYTINHLSFFHISLFQFFTKKSN